MAMKLPPPRQLGQKETLDSLDQWKNQFRIFYKRDETLTEFFRPGARWNSTQLSYGLTGEEAQTRADNLELLLNQVGSHLPFPYLNQRIVKDTKNFTDVWTIIYNHFGCKPSQSSFLQYGLLKKRQDETPLTYYERLCHHARAHLAPAGAKVNDQTNTNADTFTISLQNHIALDWIKNLDPDLLGIVQTEFETELKSGTQLAELVHTIAHSLDSLLKRNSGASANLLTTDVEDSSINYVQGSNYRGNGKNSSRGQYRGGNNWRGRSNRGRGFSGNNSSTTFGNTSSSASGNNSSNFGKTMYCPNCKFLGSQLNLSVNYNHYPGDCPRKRSAINLVLGEERSLLEQEDYEDHDEEGNNETHCEGGEEESS